MDSITGVQLRTPTLVTVLERVKTGQVVLPDFQRDFVWPRDQVVSLIQSVLEGYFIGTFLMLESDSRRSQFQYRLLEGVKGLDASVDANQHPLLSLVLDGQQRLTALFYAFYEPPIPLKDTRHPFKFYVDLGQLTQGNVSDAVQAISTSNKKLLEEFKNRHKSGEVLPLSYFKDSSRIHRWLYTEQDRWKQADIDKIDRIVNVLMNQTIQSLNIDRDTPPETVVNTFERLNKAGLKLSVFDLAAAHLYTKRIFLRDRWKSLQSQLPTELTDKDFIQADAALRITAILNDGDPRTGKLINSLPKEPNMFAGIWDKTCLGIAKAWQRLKEQYGVLNASFMPNKSMLVPLAAMLGKHESKRLNSSANLKIDTWYWVAVFEQRYANSADSKSVNDYVAIGKWIASDEKPEFIKRFELSKLDLMTKDRKEDAALFKAVKCLLLLNKAKDLKTGLFVSDDFQDDHLFPESTETLHGNLGNILNLALLNETTNKEKSAKSPRAFIAECLRSHDGDKNRLLQTLESQLINEASYEMIVQENYKDFLLARNEAIKNSLKTLITF